MNKIQKFRNILAEKGIEMNMEQAKEAFKNASKFIKKSKKISMFNLWEIKKNKYEGITEEEKNEIIELYKKAKEL